MDEPVVIDVETSGTNPHVHDVLAVAVVPLDAHKEPLEVYIRQHPIVWSARAREYFENYQTAWEQQAVSPREAYRRIGGYLSQLLNGRTATLLGHNIAFDMAFLRKLAFQAGHEQFTGISHRTVDTHTLLFMLVRNGILPSDTLTSTGAFRHFGISVPSDKRHTALHDAIATRALYLELVDLYRDCVDAPAL